MKEEGQLKNWPFFMGYEKVQRPPDLQICELIPVLTFSRFCLFASVLSIVLSPLN